VTKEQLIVLGFLAAAFLAGWLAHAVIGRRERGRPAIEDQPTHLDPRLERAIDASTRELEGAIRRYVATLVTALVGKGAPANEAQRPAERDTLRLEDAVSAALRSDAANEAMLRAVVAGREAGLTELELDLADWGFAYGVAWARARERSPGTGETELAHEARAAADAVFGAYTGGTDWTRQLGQRHVPQSEPGNGSEARLRVLP
jgi:hypothetical protein